MVQLLKKFSQTGALKLALTLCIPAVMTPTKSFALEFKQVSEVKNISQLMRSNAPHFWEYSRNPNNLGDLAKYLDAEGIIYGDAHLGNTSVIPVKSTRGESHLRFLNIDFDDGGKGPFALELARFVAVAIASSKNLRVEDLVEVYFRGLQGQEMTKPSPIVQAENMSMQEYEGLRSAYVNKKMTDGHFKYKAGEIEKWNGRPNIQDIAPLFSGTKVIEVAKRPVDRGGSAEAGVRLWVLTQDAAGAFRISELKPYADTALSEYSTQAAPQARVRDLHETYWQGIDPASYTLVNLQGTPYWLREKKVEVLEYQDNDQEDRGRYYIANLIGLTQARQEAGPGFLKKIEKDPTRFKDAIKMFVKEYEALATGAEE